MEPVTLALGAAAVWAVWKARQGADQKPQDVTPDPPPQTPEATPFDHMREGLLGAAAAVPVLAGAAMATAGAISGSEWARRYGRGGWENEINAGPYGGGPSPANNANVVRAFMGGIAPTIAAQMGRTETGAAITAAGAKTTATVTEVATQTATTAANVVTNTATTADATTATVIRRMFGV